MSIFQVGWNDQKANKTGAETHYRLIPVFSQRSINIQPFWTRNLRGNVTKSSSQEENIATTTKWSCLDLVCNAISVYSHQNMLSNYISCFFTTVCCNYKQICLWLMTTTVYSLLTHISCSSTSAAAVPLSSLFRFRSWGSCPHLGLFSERKGQNRQSIAVALKISPGLAVSTSFPLAFHWPKQVNG